MAGRTNNEFLSTFFAILRIIRFMFFMTLTFLLVYIYYLSTKGLLLKKLAPVIIKLEQNPIVMIIGLIGFGIVSFIFYLGYRFGKYVHTKNVSH